MALFGKADAELPLLTQIYQVDVDNYDELTAFISRWEFVLGMLGRLKKLLTPTAYERLRSGDWSIVEDNPVYNHPRIAPIMCDDDDEEENWEATKEEIERTTPDYSLTATKDGQAYFDICNALVRIRQVFRLVHRMMDTLYTSSIRYPDLKELENLLHHAVRTFDIPQSIARYAPEDLHAPMIVEGDYVRIPRLGPDPLISLDNVEPALKILGRTGASSYGFQVIMDTATALDALIMDKKAGRANVARCVVCKSCFISRRGAPRYCSHRCTSRDAMRRMRSKIETADFDVMID